MLDNAIATIQTTSSAIENSIEEEKQKILYEYRQSEQYKTDFLKAIRPEILKGLSFVHDYKQINSQIRQNINVIIESKYPGQNLEEKLRHANHEEKAIYEASKFLEEKLNIAKFILHPEWLEKTTECSKFRFHGMVFKYARIYESRMNKKNLKVIETGNSTNEVVANPEAVAVIVHTLIDNATKYSAKGGKIEIFVQDRASGIDFSVSSYGPRIRQDEEEKIFSPFYRGEAATKMEEEGAGYGLYISQMVAIRHLGSIITVAQEPKQTPHQGHWTTFGIQIPLYAAILH